MRERRDRPKQRQRTRHKLLAAAAVLIARGQSPSTTEVAAVAGVSRRTAFRYFPTQEQLHIEAALEGLRPRVEEAISKVTISRADASKGDVAFARARLDATVRVMHALAIEHEPLLRTIRRLTAAGPRARGVSPRGSRRVDWISTAVAPVRARLGSSAFERLVSALCVCVGFDALFVLRDVRGASPDEALRLTLWLAEAALDASIEGARPPREARRPSGKSPPRR